MEPQDVPGARVTPERFHPKLINFSYFILATSKFVDLRAIASLQRQDNWGRPSLKELWLRRLFHGSIKGIRMEICPDVGFSGLGEPEGLLHIHDFAKNISHNHQSLYARPSQWLG